MGVDDPLRCGRHDPGRRVRRVAHGGVGGSLGDAHLGGEDVTAVDAELQRQGQAGIRDVAQRAHHAPLVVLLGHRHARAEEELAAVGVDVRGEQRDALGVEGLLHPADEGVQRAAERLGALLREDGVGAREADEADRRDAVLRVGWPGSEVGAELDREERVQEGVAAGGNGSRRTGRGVGGPPPQEQLPVVTRPRRPGGEAGRGVGTDDDLAGVRHLLRLGGGRGGRPEDEELTGGRARRGTARRRRSARRPTSRGTGGPPRSAPRRPRAVAARISTVASQACSGCPSPRKRKSSASPPNFSSSPPRVLAMRSIGPKTRFSVSTISSAPMRPRRESRSVRAVKPDTSAKTSVPSTTRDSWPGTSSSQTSVTGGTCRRRSDIWWCSPRPICAWRVLGSVDSHTLSASGRRIGRRRVR